MSSRETLEEKKTKVLIKLRGYKLLKRQELKNAISFTVKAKDKTKALVWAIPTKGAVGVAYISTLKKAMDEEKIERGIIITSGRYTQAAKTRAKKKGIELIPRIFPSFNIFDHKFVSKHEIVTAEEKEKLLAKYKVQPFQLPRIRTSDPAITAIGAAAGDVVKITRESPTAGKYVAYRYVIEG